MGHPMPTIIDTPGASTANSFASAAFALAYHDDAPQGGAWAVATDEARARCLIGATRVLSPLAWAGSQTTSVQALAWPRTAAPDPDAPVGFTGLREAGYLYYAQDVVPRRVQEATCELALELLKAGTSDPFGPDPSLNVILKTVDVLTTQYAEPHQRKQGLGRYPRVLALITPLLANGGAPRVVRS
jgi:hypothetical protein